MSTRLTLADLDLPDDIFDGFTPEQVADVVRAAEDGANARIAIILGDDRSWTPTIAQHNALRSAEANDHRMQLAVSL